jgi:NAD(P)-dependent dehydrogenase (short-subunit alcohol dehydrogenase family)/acyl carrier protein
MANKGARHLIVLSRSGLSESNTEAIRTVKELRERGVTIITPTCDASSLPDLSTQLAQCAETMPAIAGCINAAMSLQDAVFENMTYEQWALTIDSKVKTTFNLHQLLPVGSLDFFVLFSSLSGIYGSIAQSNYAAGCTFQDAIAKQRASRGENAVSLDIGWMRTIGIIAEKTEYQRNRENTGDMMAIESEELLGVLSQVCRPAISNARHQVLIGAVTPEHFYARGKNPAPSLQRPLFSGFGTRTGSRFKATNQENSTEDEPSKLFKQATSSKEKALVVARAIIIRIARALAIPVEEVESSKQLSDYGVDSLMAVELRNWIGRDFQTNVAVFEIMSGTTIQGLGQLVAERAG